MPGDWGGWGRNPTAESSVDTLTEDKPGAWKNWPDSKTRPWVTKARSNIVNPEKDPQKFLLKHVKRCKATVNHEGFGDLLAEIIHTRGERYYREGETKYTDEYDDYYSYERLLKTYERIKQDSPFKRIPAERVPPGWIGQGWYFSDIYKDGYKPFGTYAMEDDEGNIKDWFWVKFKNGEGGSLSWDQSKEWAKKAGHCKRETEDKGAPKEKWGRLPTVAELKDLLIKVGPLFPEDYQWAPCINENEDSTDVRDYVMVGDWDHTLGSSHTEKFEGRPDWADDPNMYHDDIEARTVWNKVIVWTTAPKGDAADELDEAHIAQTAEGDDADETVDALKAKAMLNMVEDIEVGGVHKKLLFLTSAQAKLVSRTPHSIKRLFDLLETPEPRLVINLLKSRGTIAETLGKCGVPASTTKVGDCMDASGRVRGSHSWTSLEEAVLAEKKLDRFMSEVVIPIAAENNAVVLCDCLKGACFLSASFNRVFSMMAAQWSGKPPITVISFFGSLESLYHNPSKAAQWRQLRNKSKHWKNREIGSGNGKIRGIHEIISDQPHWKLFGQADIDMAGTNFIIVDGLEPTGSWENSSDEPLNKLKVEMVRHLTDPVSKGGKGLSALAFKTGFSARTDLESASQDSGSLKIAIDCLESSQTLLFLDLRECRVPQLEPNHPEIEPNDPMDSNLAKATKEEAAMDAKISRATKARERILVLGIASREPSKEEKVWRDLEEVRRQAAFIESDRASTAKRGEEIIKSNSEIQKKLDDCSKHLIEATFRDDHQSPISALAYIHLRVIPTMDKYRAQLPGLARQKMMCQMFLFVCTGSGAAMTYAGLTPFVAIVSCTATAVSSWMAFENMGHKIHRHTSTVRSLESQLSWWASLTDVAKSSERNITCLVLSCEQIITSEQISWHAKEAETEHDDGDHKSDVGTPREIKPKEGTNSNS